MELLASLILAHLIADFPLQFNGIYKLKSRHWAGVLLHSGIHGLVAALLLQNPLAHWPPLVTLCVTHFAIDWLKLQISFKVQSLGFALDQTAHLLTLILLATWPSEVNSILAPSFLYPALAYALVPTLLMFFSVLAIDLKDTTSNITIWRGGKAPPIILLSQLTGYPLVIGVMILRLVYQY
jgi:hypothetical protein